MLLDIFCLLIQHLKCQAPALPASGFSPRVNKVVMWIGEHYRDNITLQHIAAQLRVSVAHLSRQFTHETGMNFRDWLTQVRFRQAVNDIAHTTRPIGIIVNDSGFASLRRYSALFRSHYDLTPSDYRRKIQQSGRKIPPALLPEDTQQTGKVDATELFSLLSHRPQSDPLLPKWGSHIKTIGVDLRRSQSTTALKQHGYVIAVGMFDELLKQHIQQQLGELHARVPLCQLDVSDPLCGSIIYRTVHTGELSPTWSPWSSLDMATRFLRTLGVSPMIRLSPFTSRLTFAEHLKWLKAFIDHNILLLGRDFVQGWSFIVDGRDAGNPQQLIICSLALFEMLRTVLPGCRLELSWLPAHETDDYIQGLAANGLMAWVDFLGLSVTPNASYDFSGDPASIPQENEHVIHQQISNTVRRLKKHGIQREVYLQSWSTLTGNTLRTNGLFFRGALLMNTLLGLPNDVVMLGFWLNSALQNEVLDHHEIDNNSLSLFFSGTTKRPMFHILTLKERLKVHVFARSEGWLATCHLDTITLLLLNPVTINPLLSVQQHLLNDYNRRYSVNIALEDAGIWRIKQWVFDQKNGALYYQYGLHPTQDAATKRRWNTSVTARSRRCRYAMSAFNGSGRRTSC